MPLTSSALQIGSSALIAYQQALQLTGNNIANAGNPIYSRLTARFSPRTSGNVSGLQIGLGVRVGSIQRHTLEALESRLRSAVSSRDAALNKKSALDRIESLLNGLGDTNPGTALNDLFSAFSDLQNESDDPATRGIVIARAQALTDALKSARKDLLDLHKQSNEDIVSLTTRADELATQIADLNVQVASADTGGPGASGPLRDQRNALLSELAGLLQITTQEQPNGAVNVYIGSEALVQAGISRGLKTTVEAGAPGLNNAVVRIAADNSKAVLTGGQIAGAIAARDGGVVPQLSRLDTLAKALIQEVNKAHASGQGLTGYTTLSGTNAVGDVNAALNSAAAGLDLTPKSGSFFVLVRDDATGAEEKIQIDVDLDGLNANDTTLTSLAAQVNAAAGGSVTATVLPDGRLKLDAAAGSSFAFADDQSHVLAALGINTFFTGTDSSDIAVNSLVVASPSLIAAAQSGLAGDGANAGVLAGVLDLPAALLGSVSLADYFKASVSQSAVDTNAAGNALDAADVVVGALGAQRESISGVNLDEEAVRLVTYQRAYQAAAQYLSVVDEMLQTMLGLVR